MTPKPTPSGRALEDFESSLHELDAESNCISALSLYRETVETIRTALLRSQAIESGSDAHEFASRKAQPDDYMRGYRDCLESLKGIGHDDR